jgi:hypothetical protein
VLLHWPLVVAEVEVVPVVEQQQQPVAEVVVL